MTRNKLIFKFSIIYSLLFVLTLNANSINSIKSASEAVQNVETVLNEKNPMKIRIIILNPRGREIPSHASRSINEIAAYAHDFYIKGMKMQGYPAKNKDIFELNSKGKVKIYIANSPSSMYEIVDIKNKHAYDHIVGEKPAFENSVWWVFSNINDEVKYGFSGGGSAVLGTSIANLPQKYQKITPDMDLGSSGYFTENKMKAVVHELGHALQLPHNGPIPASLGKDPKGNTLMGPIIKSFKKRYDANEDRVYLSKLSAAMLWKHPVFNNTYYTAYDDTSFEIADIKMDYNEEKNFTKIIGKINTSLPYHSVVLIDVQERKPRPSSKKKSTNVKKISPSYQDRGYVAALDKNGNFEFSVDKMISQKGSFIIVVCFNNGLITSKINSKDEVKKNWEVLKYNFLD